MASLNIKSFAQMVEDAAAAMQARTTQLIDLSVGSINRATAQAASGLGLWLESLIVYVMTLKWASSSRGADLDNWMADFGLIRLAASPSTGLVTFARYTATALGYVPVGATVKTVDGLQQFNVIVDPTNGAFDAVNNRYILPVAVNQIAVSVQGYLPPTSTAGSATNVPASSIGLITSAIPGIDYCFNASPFVNGTDAETDEQLRARFPNYLLSLSKATKAAVAYAVQSLQNNMQVQVVENQGYDGTPRLGFFYVVFDDGSGQPSSALTPIVYAAVDAVRAQGVMVSVVPAVANFVNVSLAVTAAAGYDITALRGAVGAALDQYLNTLPLGAGLTYTRLAQVAYDASPGVANVSGVLLNGAVADIVADPRYTIKTTSITVD